jgi:SAP domain-containing protein
MSQYDDYTATQMQDELRARGLPVSGSKPELLARLEESDTAAKLAETTAAAEAAEAALITGVAEAAATGQVEEAAEPARRSSNCVADDGRPHVGNAVNGKVCSAHAISHRADGTPR